MRPIEALVSFKVSATTTPMVLFTVTTILLLLINCYMTQAQIVSHELRRLAVSTNQFGIDALKALDRIEPPDKVLVFCPVCLSSSLMMIMMGSSKYQVVSSFRHALYVWSMKPQAINRGFKDIFEHIGLNQQQQQIVKDQPIQVPLANTRAHRQNDETKKEFNYVENISQIDNQTSKWNSGRWPRSVYSDDSMDVIYGSLSLPQLMRLRESHDRQIKETGWWTLATGRKSDDSSKSGSSRAQSVNFTQNDNQKFRPTFKTGSNISQTQQHPISNEEADDGLDKRDLSDISQMSAISNIYIQRGLIMNYNYNLLLRQYYKTVIHPVDFIHNGEETRQHINSLVAANTEGKIKDLVKKGTLSSAPSPKIMIISTFHFRGTLDIQVKGIESLNANADSNTNQDNNKSRFTTTKTKRNGKTISNQLTNVKQNQTSHRRSAKIPVFIETEVTLLKYGQFNNLDCSVVEIPFNNRLVSLVIVMPNNHNSTELLLTKLSAQILSDMINSLVVRKISIEIPVIKFDRGPINVEGILKELGLENSFYSDRVYTSETGLNKWMRPSDIVHETSIDIGTINPKWGQTEDRLKVGAHDSRSDSHRKARDSAINNVNHLKLDKPFFYFVLDSINGLVLTMGRIRQ